MNKKKIVFLILLILTSNKVYAYIDPGSFSLFLQAIIAALATAIGFFSMFKVKIKKLISKIFKWKK